MAKKDRDDSSPEAPGSRRRRVQYAAGLTTEDAAAYLEALAQALRGNRLIVRAADATLDVPVSARVEINLEAKTSANRRKSSIDLELSWDEPQALTISSGSSDRADDDGEVSAVAPTYEPSAADQDAAALPEAAESADQQEKGT